MIISTIYKYSHIPQFVCFAKVDKIFRPNKKLPQIIRFDKKVENSSKQTEEYDSMYQKRTVYLPSNDATRVTQ